MTPLHWIGDLLRALLMQVPLWAVRVLFVLLPVLLLVWVLTLPRSATTPPDGHGGWSENLKYGAAAALLIQIVVYLLLG